jgi:hypothetical protein
MLCLFKGHTYGRPQRKFVLTSGFLTTELIVVVGILLVIYFFLTNCLSVFETVSTPLTMENYGWSVTENALMWTVIVRMGRVYVDRYRERFRLLGILR